MENVRPNIFGKSWSVNQIFEFAPDRRYCNLEVHYSLILLVLR